MRRKRRRWEWTLIREAERLCPKCGKSRRACDPETIPELACPECGGTA